MDSLIGLDSDESIQPALHRPDSVEIQLSEGQPVASSS